MKEKIVLFKVIITLAIAISSIVILTSLSLPFNPIKDRSEKINIRTILPQGWGFFTRNPREEQAYLYKKISDNSAWEKITTRYSSIENLFGLSRKNRALNVKMAIMESKINRNLIQKCKGTLSSCMESLNSNMIDTLEYTPEFGSLHGNLMIKYEKPIPWAWRKSIKSHENRPIKIIKIYIPCKL